MRLPVQGRYAFVDLFTMHQATHLVDRMAVWVAECDVKVIAITDGERLSTFASNFRCVTRISKEISSSSS